MSGRQNREIHTMYNNMPGIKKYVFYSNRFVRLPFLFRAAASRIVFSFI